MKRIKLLLATTLTMVMLNGFVYGQDTTLTVTSAGNVGIGTTDPQQKLHVAGGFILANGLGNEQAYIGGDGAGADVQVGSFNSAVTNFAIWNEATKTRMNLFANDMFAFGNVGIGTTSPTAKLHIGGTAGVDGIKFPDGTLQTTAATGGSGLWSASGSDIFYNSGNVGIGTTTPQSTLDIQGTVRATGDVTVGALTKFNGTPTLQASVIDASTNTVVDVLELDRGSTGVVGDGIGAGILFRSEGSSGGFSSIARIAASLEDVGGTTDRGALSFWTFPAGGGSLQERMRINHIGNVGIGTTSPGSGFNTKLDVVGPISFRTNLGDIAKAIKIDFTGTSHRIYTDAISGTPYDLILGTYPNGHSNQLVLQQSTGNVGIGTTSPNHPLEMGSGAHVTAGGVWTDASSRQYKENISNLTQEEAISALEEAKSG